jgi:hypothetical protein
MLLRGQRSGDRPPTRLGREGGCASRRDDDTPEAIDPQDGTDRSDRHEYVPMLETARILVARVRAVSPKSAVCVGLGVSNGRQAEEVAQFADGVIVGSALVRCLLDSPDAAGISALTRLAADLADGVRATAG